MAVKSVCRDTPNSCASPVFRSPAETRLRISFACASVSLKNPTIIGDNDNEGKIPSGSQRCPGEGVHKVLWDLYERNTDKNCKSLAVLATRMKLRRVKADYDSFYPRIAEEVVAVLQDAEECATILQNLDPKYPEPIEKKWSY